jgi:hypothetical protein
MAVPLALASQVASTSEKRKISSAGATGLTAHRAACTSPSRTPWTLRHAPLGLIRVVSALFMKAMFAKARLGCSREMMRIRLGKLICQEGVCVGGELG